MGKQPHSSDLTDAQWAQIRDLIPAPQGGGRYRSLDMRQVVNAILHLLHTHCRWRQLPASYPNRSSVRHYYDRWRRDGVWSQIERALAKDDIVEPRSDQP
jgi:putative transposase